MTHPILVGVGQRTIRTKSLQDFIHPIEAMTHVVREAALDAECAALLDKADAIHVVNVLAWNLRDAPTELAESLGINPGLKEYTAVGGNTPQWLVNRAADNIASGRSEITVLAGCEVMRSVAIAMNVGHDLGFFKHRVEAPLVGNSRRGVSDDEHVHFADRPIRVYPMIENALRAKAGMSLEGQRKLLGKFGEDFSAIAAENPHAWFPIARTAEEIVTAGPKNRIVSYPYTKYLNAIMAVDQAAAVIMTTPEVAERLGVPREKWVYLHGGQDAHDIWLIGERPDLAASPAIKGCAADSLEQAGLEMSDMNFFDFYSCFHAMVRLACRELGIADDDPRPLTLTGGLPYFGGAGNNYVMHSIAHAVERCRENPEHFGMITANGMYATKHAYGIYGASEPETAWSRTSPEQFQEELAQPKLMKVDSEPKGEFAVEAYTVWHSREGEPQTGILCGRTPEGNRAWAQTPKGDIDVLVAMESEEFVGKRGKITGRVDGVNQLKFD